MWWMKLSILKCMAGNINASVWRGSVCLSTRVNLWQVTFSPSLFCFATVFQTITWSWCFCYNTLSKEQHEMWKLIFFAGTAQTEPVLPNLKKQRNLWHPLSLWKVHVIVPHSVGHPRDTLRGVLQRGPRGTELGEKWGWPRRRNEGNVMLLMRRKGFSKELGKDIIAAVRYKEKKCNKEQQNQRRASKKALKH